MAQAVLRIEGLPEGALDEAATFHTNWLPRAAKALETANELVLIFAAASYDHRGWRLAAVQDLARKAAPKRVNAVAGDDEQAIASTTEWLAQAPGITGQLLAVDGKSGAKD
jgi:hypothetical protein